MANILIKQGREIAGSSLVTPSTKADKTDLSSIIQTGTVSTQAISAGKYFYLNDVLVRAKTSIASGATFTLNANYEVVTAGALNEMNGITSFSVITADTPKNFCYYVSVDLVSKLNILNKFVPISYIWSGMDIYTGYAIRRDNGYIMMVLSSASASIATFNSTYNVAQGTLRVAVLSGTQA